MAVIAIEIYRRSDGATRAGIWVLALASLLLAAGAVANVWYFTAGSGGTDALPVLQNTDAHRNFYDARAILGYGGEIFHASHSFYNYVLAAVFLITGPSVAAATLVSVACTLATLVISSAIARAMGCTKSQSALAMGLTASVCYLLASGVVIVKDAWVICATAACALSLARMSDSERGPNWSGLIVGTAMLAIVRPNFLIAPLLGIWIVWLLRHDRKSLTLIIIYTAVVIAVWGFLLHIGATPGAADYIQDENSNWYLEAPNHQAYSKLLGPVSTYPVWRRVLMLPVTALVQFLVPFPWNFARDTIFGPSLAYAHFAYPWYFFGATAAFYLLYFRRFLSRHLFWFTFWGLILWLIPAYAAIGTVSRYALPAVPVLAPAVALTLAKAWKTKAYAAFMIIFVALLAITLIVCHTLQAGT